ncbi:hypothetical protein INS49_010467 [Diaporthe citri]|uniref:uncharacterized protein n=1 Tax=Diaporthe citri TaxID=83186 RepID=UPI001C81F5B9|nr:uncharacterized protein INS49_010467 [Diaporthe citri]KAG6362237.1 hypothetical protein INS49_010467 [Diaporthe citri]
MFSAIGVNVSDILKDRPMDAFIVPELDNLIDLEDKVPHYPYTKTFEEAAHDPYMILHTSGSTGDPKPIVYTHAMISTQDAQELLPDVCGRKRFAHRAVRPEEICDILDYANVTRALFTPWMMDQIARQPNAQSYIEPFDSAMYCGANISDTTARIWAQWTTFQSAWGATETLAPPQLVGDNEDHEYVFFDPIYSGIHFRDVETTYTVDDGTEIPLYEMVFTVYPKMAHVASWHANSGVDIEAIASSEGIASEVANRTYPELRIGDIWTPHPDPAKSQYAWRFVGRADDIITFTSGVNYHPGPMEKSIKSEDAVTEVLILGRGHRQPVLLVELHAKEGEFDAEEEKRKLWATRIEGANSSVPVHGRVAYSHILVLPAGSLIRTLKGNVMRRQTESKFSDLIDEVYEKSGDEWQDNRERYASISKSVSLEVSVEEQGSAS